MLGKDGDVPKEFDIRNESEDLERLAQEHPKARVVMELGTHSPWISRLFASAGLEVIVANARKLCSIYDHERSRAEGRRRIEVGMAH